MNNDYVKSLGLSNKIGYLASPYSSEDSEVRAKRYEQALLAKAKLMNQNLMVYSPIVENHPMAEWFEMETTIEFWKAYDTKMLLRSDYLVVLPLDGWEESVGVAYEIAIWKDTRCYTGSWTGDYPIYFVANNYQLVTAHPKEW